MLYRWGKFVLLALGVILAAVALLTPAASMAKGSAQAYGCPTTSTNTYAQGPVFEYDLDNPVRPAADSADKNFMVRGTDGPDIIGVLVPVDYGPSSDHALPPQLATLFRPVRVPDMFYASSVADWTWEPSPNPGYSSGFSVPFLDVGVVTMETFDNEELHLPAHSRNLGKPFGKGGAIVLYADETSITLKFTREDSVARGYSMHLLNICTDPNLLALYRSLDNADRNSIGPGSGNFPRDLTPDYQLPGLTRGQVFGTSINGQIGVAIRDEGSFLDPRSRRDWWRIQ